MQQGRSSKDVLKRLCSLPTGLAKQDLHAKLASAGDISRLQQL